MPRGSDFAARWAEGAWAELKIIETINREAGLHAVQFGITEGTAFWSSREMEARDLPEQDHHGKRPDILVFAEKGLTEKQRSKIDDLYQMDDGQADGLVNRAALAIESEFSPYDYGHRLREYGKELSFTLKDEDLAPLREWTSHFPVPLALVQVYFDSSFYLSFASLMAGIASGEIKRKRERAYNKDVYYPPMSRGIRFGSFEEPPKIEAGLICDKYGKYTPYRKTTGGRVCLSDEMREEMKGLCREARRREGK